MVRQIAAAIKPERYLEVGIEYGRTLLAVKAKEKVGIDPAPKLKEYPGCKIYKGKSDDIFESSDFDEEPFDLIFIDGYHEYNQVVRDIENSTRFLVNDSRGMIVCHDVWPFDLIGKKGFEHLLDKEYPGPSYPWCGDVWKAIYYIESCRPDFDYTVDKIFPGYLRLWRNEKMRHSKISLSKEEIGKMTLADARVAARVIGLM